jgi:hypothetical protein
VELGSFGSDHEHLRANLDSELLMWRECFLSSGFSKFCSRSHFANDPNLWRLARRAGGEMEALGRE